MYQELDTTLDAYRNVDRDGHARDLFHAARPFRPGAQMTQLAAREYLTELGHALDVQPSQLENLELEPERRPEPALGVEYRFLAEKRQFDSTTSVYQQTFLGLPVWNAGLSVHMKEDPLRVLSAQSTAHHDIKVKRPPIADVRRWEKLDPKQLALLLGLKESSSRTAVRVGEIRSVRLVVFRYEADERFDRDDHPRRNVEEPQLGVTVGEAEHPHLAIVPVPPVSEEIRDGEHYVAAEVVFTLRARQGELAWIAIFDVRTNAVLYLRAFVDDANALVFLRDPITATGNAADSPAASNSVLNPLRTAVTLQGLTAPPAGGNQALSGNFIQISDFELATAAPPTEAPGTDFNFAVRTNNFAAVNAYHHTDRFFRLVQDLGFPIATYFDGTSFPIPVDHRGRFGSIDGIERNASCSGTGTGGIANVDFELADLGDTSNPIGIAADWRVVLHELGGHAILYDHVNSANFGFAHSAGDSFGAILNDPDTLAGDRFETFPWVSFIGRRHDRAVGSGWAWGGSNDTGGYNSEQILCTTHFRIYRSIGGDSADLNMRRFAARFMAYLILRAVGTLTQATNPSNATGYATALQTADLGDWTSEGHAGGAYQKVIRWAFEKQGMYQPPGAPTPVSAVGAPPAVDVYIEDGRNGEYQFQPNHWSCQSIWNRRANDGVATHEEPVVGVTNYAYVKIKNRGTQPAMNVVVKGYHCRPSSGLVWPNDWEPMTTAQLAAANVPPNSSGEITVGPFEWVPSELGHECMLMIASATGDASNVDNFGPGDSIPEWRLVPHDNNIGQRNVAPVAGGLTKGLLESFAHRHFWLSNPSGKTAKTTISAILPRLLAERGWELDFVNAGGHSFSLEPGASKNIEMVLKQGREFTRSELEVLPAEQRLLHVETRLDGILVGGMSYQLDPKLDRPPTMHPHRNGTHAGEKAAEELLRCLDLPGDVEDVRIRRITLEIDLRESCD
jgi:hypothetical protein